MYGKRVSPVRAAEEISRRADQCLRQAIHLRNEANDRYEYLYAITAALYAEIDCADYFASHPEAERARAASSAAHEVYLRRENELTWKCIVLS